MAAKPSGAGAWSLGEVFGVLRLRVRTLRRRNLELERKVTERTAELAAANAAKTDFVANTDEFRQLVKDLALHIASPSAPRWVTRDEVPASILEAEQKIAEAPARESGKPDNVVPKVVEGKVEAFLKDNVLLDQPFVKDDSKTIQQYLDEVGAKTGEKVQVKRFARFKLGEDAA